MRNDKKYVIDSLASVVFWVPLYILFNYFILRLDLWQVIAAAVFSATVNFIFGGLFGRFLDLWRRILYKV